MMCKVDRTNLFQDLKDESSISWLMFLNQMTIKIIKNAY